MSKRRFGVYGGQYIPETLMTAVIELKQAYNHYRDDPQFNAELTKLFNNYAGRPSLLYLAESMTKRLGSAKIYLKREDLSHTGTHKINNVLGQVFLVEKMDKARVIAGTGASQRDVATATTAALMGMECGIFMGEEGTRHQALSLYKMRLPGVKVNPITSGTAIPKDAVSEAMREWVGRIADTRYVLGSTVGPHPFPTIVRDSQAAIFKEIKEQVLQREGCLPDTALACVNGGSNAIGAFCHFIGGSSVRLIGCEAAGHDVEPFEAVAMIVTGKLRIFHGTKSYSCQDEYGQIVLVYPISVGLGYPGVGPERAHLHDTGRMEYIAITDDEVMETFEYLSGTEGVIPVIESAHAVVYAMKLAPTMARDQVIVVNLSGHGNEDCAVITRYGGRELGG